ncbi:hypothetical protein AJ80_03556 [Polytolypa hystricis UAMH7299]|uniref:Calcineurin-like phosphoesterase domain-containing protein n=1 Tax=Polytolypa hystricis (strain UAMH7299) TaxID=1447883 RepID=A0A2B7YHA8_POLH7|nr:hypothetical protein AJ80_03556 [Polytolypa hystricis UAMH7299]
MVRTRIVCVSDTHNHSPKNGAFKLPKGDVLIHAGDLTNQGSLSELRRTVEWIEEADFEAKIVIAGNHDITLDSQFYSSHGHTFHNQNLESPSECLSLFTSPSSSITYLNHQSTTIRLSNPDGPQTAFKVFGSPYSPRRGKWAFSYSPDSEDEARTLWSAIPADADIVVTHTPPFSHCDEVAGEGSVGCKILQQTLAHVVRPRLAVCGHVHESRGYERVRWAAAAPFPAEQDSSAPPPPPAPGAELVSATRRGILPPQGSKKQCLIDLTGKRGEVRLDNDGAGSGRWETCVVNAAVMASHWPHRGGRKFWAPLVVDVDLPAAEEEWGKRRR